MTTPPRNNIEEPVRRYAQTDFHDGVACELPLRASDGSKHYIKAMPVDGTLFFLGRDLVDFLLEPNITKATAMAGDSDRVLVNRRRLYSTTGTEAGGPPVLMISTAGVRAMCNHILHVQHPEWKKVTDLAEKKRKRAIELDDWVDELAASGITRSAPSLNRLAELEAQLRDLHAALAVELMDRIAAGNAPASVVNVARQLLKDSGYTLPELVEAAEQQQLSQMSGLAPRQPTPGVQPASSPQPASGAQPVSTTFKPSNLANHLDLALPFPADEAQPATGAQPASGAQPRQRKSEAPIDFDLGALIPLDDDE